MLELAMVDRLDLSGARQFKFVREGERMAVSPYNEIYHRDLAAELGMERPQIRSPNTDMGIIIREIDSIIVFGSSAGYRWPPADNPEVMGPIRVETVRQLQAMYPDLEVRSS